VIAPVAGTWLVVGLGNPGPTYADHRHNAGYRVVEALAREAGVSFSHSLRLGADIVRTRVTAAGSLGGVGADATAVALMKSRTYMNDSGRSVAKVVKYFDVAPERLVVIHDEIDLPPGSLRVKFGGGDNGHNGLKSIRRSLGTGEFYRVRVGVGRPAGNRDPVNYVLTAVPASERENYELDLAKAADATVALLTLGLEATQTRFNS
jgi:PTH1 family peptidyl-tRNA hydrolase